MLKPIIQLVILVVCLHTPAESRGQNTPFSSSAIQSGTLWLDDNQEHINAHGGGMLFHEGTYYWYGECKDSKTNSALIGVSCYSSTNLTDWKNEGVALAVMDEPGHEIEKGCVLERPKVIYNRKTNQFVMWFHLELKGKGYAAARAGCAISNTPTGPFAFLKSSRVAKGHLPTGTPTTGLPNMDAYSKTWWSPNWIKGVKAGMFVNRDLETGQMARDMTLFVDEDQKAYHIYSSEENLTLHIAELTADYTDHTGVYQRIAPGGHNEAPAIFKRKGIYWMITSGCTGWAPNAARLFQATSIMGPYTELPNPCIGKDAEKTFNSQSTYIQKIEGMEDGYLFMADRWTPKTPRYGKYVWLPILFKDEIPYLKWFESWTLSEFPHH